MENKGAEGLRNGLAVRAVVSAAAVLSISGLIKIYGLYDRIYFNKGVISAAVFILSIITTGKVADNWRRRRRIASAALLVSFLLTFTEILGTGLRLSANVGNVNTGLPSILWMVGSAVFLSPLAEPFFFWLFEKGEIVPVTYQGERKKQLNQIFLMTWLIVFLCYIPCFLAFYPGLYCYDMIWQWAMFDSGIYNTHHPLVHTLFSGGLLELGKRLMGSYNGGLAIHSLVQLGIMSGSIAFAIRYMVKIGLSRKFLVAALAFYIFYPFFPVLGISTTKDTVFGSLFLLFFVCACDMVTNRYFYRGYRLVLFIALSIVMGIFRNNAMYGLCFTALCFISVSGILVFFGKKNKFLFQWGILFLVLSIGIQGSFAVLKKGLGAEKGSAAEMLSIPCQQLARTYVYHSDELSQVDKDELELFITRDAMERYKYYVSDPVKAGLDMTWLENHKKEFMRLWFRIGRQFPGEYRLAPIYNTMGIWYMGGDSSCYAEYRMSQPFDENHVVETHSVLPSLKAGYSWFTDENIQRSLPAVSILFYTSFYAWLAFICTVALTARKQYRYLVLSMILFGYIISLIPGPCMIVRYMLGIILCMPVMTGITFYRGK